MRNYGHIDCCLLKSESARLPEVLVKFKNIFSNIFLSFWKVPIGPKVPPSTLWKPPPHNEEPRPFIADTEHRNRVFYLCFGFFSGGGGVAFINFHFVLGYSWLTML